MNNLLNLLDLAKQLHRENLHDSYRPPEQWLAGHYALPGGTYTPQKCTQCWIISKAEAELKDTQKVKP